MGMRGFGFLSVIFMCGVMAIRPVFAARNIHGAVFGDSLSFVDNTFVENDAVVMVPDIYIAQSMLLQNGGDIYGDVHVDNGCDLYLQNSGNIFGDVLLGLNSSVTQIIRAPDELTGISVRGEYNVFVDGGVFGFSELLGNVVGATDVVLNNVKLEMRGGGMARRIMAADPNIELRGTFVIDLSGMEMPTDGILMRNVYGDAQIDVVGAALGELFRPTVYLSDGMLYLGRVRETDYYKILGDARGDFLNALREIAPDDELLARMDAATDMGQLHDIMSHSIAFNPMIMSRVVRIVNAVATDVVRPGVLSNDGGGMTADCHASPFYVFDDAMEIYGAMGGVHFRTGEHFDVDMNLYGATSSTDDDFNTYDADMYGGNVGVVYNGKRFRVNARGGATYATFRAPYIFDDGHIRTSARGKSIYGMTDFGPVFEFGDVVEIRPRVGAQYDDIRIIDDTDTNIVGRYGIDIGGVSKSGALSGAYDYRAGITANTNGDVVAGAAMGFWSEFDMAGGDVAINGYHDDAGWAYILSLTVRAAF